MNSRRLTIPSPKPNQPYVKKLSTDQPSAGPAASPLLPRQRVRSIHGLGLAAFVDGHSASPTNGPDRGLLPTLSRHSFSANVRFGPEQRTPAPQQAGPFSARHGATVPTVGSTRVGRSCGVQDLAGLATSRTRQSAPWSPRHSFQCKTRLEPDHRRVIRRGLGHRCLLIEVAVLEYDVPLVAVSHSLVHTRQQDSPVRHDLAVDCGIPEFCRARRPLIREPLACELVALPSFFRCRA
jgi:hypothetical protein